MLLLLNCGDSLLIVDFGFIKSILKEKIINKGHLEWSGEIIVEKSNKHESVIIVLELSIFDGALVFVEELVYSIEVVWVIFKDR